MWGVSCVGCGNLDVGRLCKMWELYLGVWGCVGSDEVNTWYPHYLFEGYTLASKKLQRKGI